MMNEGIPSTCGAGNGDAGHMISFSDHSVSNKNLEILYSILKSTEAWE